MKVKKAYIIRIDSDISQKYATHCAISCEKNDMPYEFFEGFTEKDELPQIWKKLALKTTPTVKGKGGAATASHIGVWKKILESGEAAIILEHDAILLHKLDINIPDGEMVVLGYKVVDPQNYDHTVAGPPNKIESRAKHGGAHAYAITPNTAKILLDDIHKHGLTRMIDNAYFLRLNGKHKNQTKLSITDPICALGWVRESTIWKKAAIDNYGPLLESFKKNYHSKENLGLKK